MTLNVFFFLQKAVKALNSSSFSNIISLSPTLYLLRQLKRANIMTKDLITFYTTCIHPFMEYACAVFYHVLFEYHSVELKSLQKSAFSIIFPLLSSGMLCQQQNLISLAEPRRAISAKLFADI